MKNQFKLFENLMILLFQPLFQPLGVNNHNFPIPIFHSLNSTYLKIFTSRNSKTRLTPSLTLRYDKSGQKAEDQKAEDYPKLTHGCVDCDHHRPVRALILRLLLRCPRARSPSPPPSGEGVQT